MTPIYEYTKPLCSQVEGHSALLVFGVRLRDFDSIGHHTAGIFTLAWLRASLSCLINAASSIFSSSTSVLGVWCLRPTKVSCAVQSRHILQSQTCRFLHVGCVSGVLVESPEVVLLHLYTSLRIYKGLCRRSSSSCSCSFLAWFSLVNS